MKNIKLVITIFVIIYLILICWIIIVRRSTPVDPNNSSDTYSKPDESNNIEELDNQEIKNNNTTTNNTFSGQTIKDVSTSSWSLIINNINKTEKFSETYGSYQVPITLRIVDPTNNSIILEVTNLTTKNTDLNDFLPTDTEYYLRFYDANGIQMLPAWPNIKVIK